MHYFELSGSLYIDVKKLSINYQQTNKQSKQKTHRFFIKISKSGLKEFIACSRKPKPRLMQILLFVIAFSRAGKVRLGQTYTYGKSKGQLCWNKELRKKLSNFTGLGHAQIHRYLRHLKEAGWIKEVRQRDMLDPTAEAEYWLVDNNMLLPKAGEKYLIYELRGKGKKSFDILADIEAAYKKELSPKDKTQLKWNLPARTRRHRQAKQRKVTLGRQEMIPIDILTPLNSINGVKKKLQRVIFFKKGFIEKKISHSPGEDVAHSVIELKLLSNKTLKVPWYETKLSDDRRCLFSKGKIFHRSPDGWSEFEITLPEWKQKLIGTNARLELMQQAQASLPWPKDIPRPDFAQMRRDNLNRFKPAKERT